MTQPIDVTYVELRARGEDEAAREIRKAINDVSNDVERAAQEMETSLETAFQDASKSASKSLKGISDDIDRETKRSKASLSEFGDGVSEVFDEVEDAVAGAAGALGGRGGGGGGAGGGLLGQLGMLSSQLKGLAGMGPIPILAALAAAVPAIIALGGALLDLSAALLALPAAIAVLGASFAVLKTAFSGFGDAVSALASGDLEKINEAMKNLAPSAQQVAREINALREPFSQLRKEVQQAFFGPLVGDLTRLATEVLPTLRAGMSGTANAFGSLASQILDLLGQNDIVDVFGDVFESTERIVRNLSPEIVDFLGTLFGVIEHGLPFVERAFDALGRGLESLTGFLSGSLQSGDFEKFLNDAFATMKDLFDLTKAVFGLLQAVFGDAGDEGRTFIQTLTDLTNQMTAFFESADGQEILQKTLDTLPLIMSVLEAGLTILGALIILQNATFNGFRVLGEGAVVAGKAIGEFFQAAWDWIKRAGTAIGDFFVSLGGWFVGVGQSIQDAWNAVMRFGGQVVAFVTAIPGQIWAALQALPGLLVDIFVTSLNNAAYMVGFLLGTIVAFFRDLPSRTWEQLMLLANIISTVFTSIWDQSVQIFNALIDAVVFLFTDLPVRIGAGLVALFNKVKNFFTQTKNTGQNLISQMIAAVLRFFNDLPGRVTSALNNFKNRVISIFTSIKNSAYNIGRDIINGIKNGIGDAIGGAIELAKNAARRIVDGFKDALSVGSPSKLMAAEVGVPIMQGVGAGIMREAPTVRQEIEQATRRIIPEASSLATGFGGTSGGGAGDPIFSFGPGSIQIVFEGVTPSQSEAQRTGMAVGSGIMQTLARQNARTAVRTR